MELKNAYDDLMVAATDDRSNMDDYHSQELVKMKEKYEKEVSNWNTTITVVIYLP